MKKLIIISGCSGGGKSTLVTELSNLGYTVVHEVGREIVKEQLAVNGDITPWQNPVAFCELLIARSISAFNHAKTISSTKSSMIFFDRSFLEGISYYQSLKIIDAHKYDHYIENLKYYPTIFMTPPWKEIFHEDDERKHTFEEAMSEYARLLKFYPQCGYSMIELPKISVNERIEWLIFNYIMS